MVRQAADVAGLNRRLVAAVVVQESRGNPWASRWERGFYERRLRGKGRKDLAGWLPAVGECPSLEDEILWRSHSFGLMQILGETARSQLDFRGQYLHELCEPRTNLSLGCAFLQKLLQKARGDTKQALLKWNGGGRPAYAPEVLELAENDPLVEKLTVI